ncbi:MAG: rod shape-determining protein [Puniceicoccales bacterium]|jgi:rod shape-determining protein MreB|nr:rod shape-determining protein [Puniceicoccales bacterium]
MLSGFKNKLLSALCKIFGFWSHDIGIDLGTANTLVFVKDKGIVLREPSVVAIYATSRRVRAVGDEAKRMLGRTPGNIITLRPMKEGVIADFEVTEAMLRYFINKVSRTMKFVPPRVIIAVPSGITEVEKRAVREAATHAGARDVLLIQEPMAAAIGVGLPVDEPSASMIVDIGGGTTEVAILSLSGMVFSRSVRIGGDEMDRSIVSFVKREYNLIIGEHSAEEIKMRLGSATPLDSELSMSIKGRDSIAGLPRTIIINSQEIREALRDAVMSIVNVVKNALEQCPPELSADLVDKGIVLAGGGSMIRNLDTLISNETGLPTIVSEDPLSAVANGTGMVLQNISLWLENE